MSGLIEGTYTGLSGPSHRDHSIAGLNTPPSRIGNGIWYATEHTSGDAWVFATPAAAGNVLFVGATKTDDAPINPLLKPEELWNIDMKMDDGSPVTGKIMARYIASHLCTTATARTDLTATYNLTRTSPSCVMHVVNPF